MSADSRVKALEGNEIKDYSRKELPRSRWADTWDVFKSNFSKIIINNLFTLLFFLPLVAIVYIRGLYVSSVSNTYPFGSNIGPAGLPSTPNVSGLAESLNMSADMMFYSLAIVAALIAAIGVAGSCYSMKKLVNTHGDFTIKSYFRGVKLCYLNVALPSALFMIVFFCTVLVSDWKDYTIAIGGSSAWPIAATVLMIILCVIVGIICMWLIAVGVSYKVGPWQLIKNSFVLIIGSFIQTVFILGLAFIPVWFLLIGGLMQVIAIVILIVFGFSYVFLVWMSYTQWVFDMYITPNIEAQKAVERSKMTKEQLAAEKEAEERRIAGEILAAGKSELVGRPILPIDGAPVPALGKTFSRADIAAVASGRQDIEKRVSDYEEEHKNDKRYVEYNKLFAEREKALKDDDKKGKKKKKISADNLLR